ncbi:MAG: SET domain-containing protein [Phycisphaerales bacterium]
MMHPHTALRFISEEIGHGVVATRDIPAGTITWAQDELDREFTPQQIDALGDTYRDLLDTYCFRNPHGRWVLCWDHARFVNHSFRSNCMTTAYNFEIAVRDIREGEELTDDYGYLNILRPFRPIDEGCDRKVVRPDDLLRYHTIWDTKLRGVWPDIPRVDQPLRVLIEPGLWRRVARIARGQEPMTSILECYYDPSGESASPGAAGVGLVNGSTYHVDGSKRGGSM